MNIHGLQKLSMVDYPGKLAATVFAGGCNLRCPFCHNALLVTRLEESPALSRREVLDFLKSRKNLLDAVVLTGGEPLLQKDAADFLTEVKNMGFLVKLDTNGCYPQTLRNILDRGIVDYVAMDIKNCPAKYPETTGIPGVDPSPVEECAKLLKASGIDYELRATVVQEFHTPEGISAMGQWQQGAPRYFLQNFEDSGNLIGNGLHGFTQEEILSLKEAADPWFPSVSVRGF